MQSTDVGVTHESATNVNEPQAIDRSENIDEHVHIVNMI